MSLNEDDWRDMEIFRGIDLNDSFVLGWKQEPAEVVFEIEASVWPDSPFYRTPKADEYTCYRRAWLAFRGCNSIAGLRPMSEAKSTTDSDGTTDYGNIDSLSQTGSTFRIYGEFGEVEIEGGRFTLEFNET